MRSTHSSRYRTGALACAVLCLVLHEPAKAQTAGAYESFSSRVNAESWLVYDYAYNEVYTPGWDLAGDGQNPDIFFTFANESAFEFYADSVASDGAFVGDYAAAGIDALGCNYYVEDAETFYAVEFILYSASEGRFYFSEYITPDASGWSFAYVSLSDGQWYIYEDGAYLSATLTPQALGNVTQVGIALYPVGVAEANGKAVSIDNFTLYGTYALPHVASEVASGNYQLSFARNPGIAYSIESSANLNDWSAIAGEQSITGNSTYTMSRQIVPGPQFFRVSIDDDLQPVPDMGGS
ncbi:MAG: hypothetical protein R3242_00445 [Akkermansiaceae bacterium]|nr:hypothetical protein [Akkermansiaceae bacterium]